MDTMKANAAALADQLAPTSYFELVGFDEFDVTWQLSAERGWMVHSYTLPPKGRSASA
jgi:glutamate decarboxylase